MNAGNLNAAGATWSRTTFTRRMISQVRRKISTTIISPGREATIDRERSRITPSDQSPSDSLHTRVQGNRLKTQLSQR